MAAARVDDQMTFRCGLLACVSCIQIVEMNVCARVRVGKRREAGRHCEICVWIHAMLGGMDTFDMAVLP
jgi:hypothetical protein